MWRFISDCELPPMKKKTQHKEDGQESNRNYKKKQKITNISKQLDERDSMKTTHIPFSFKYTGNPGPLNIDLGD